MESIDPACKPLKGLYDACFNKWFATKFLHGDNDDSECRELFNKYQACVTEAIKKQGINIEQFTDSSDPDKKTKK